MNLKSHTILSVLLTSITTNKYTTGFISSSTNIIFLSKYKMKTPIWLIMATITNRWLFSPMATLTTRNRWLDLFLVSWTIRWSKLIWRISGVLKSIISLWKSSKLSVLVKSSRNSSSLKIMTSFASRNPNLKNKYAMWFEKADVQLSLVPIRFIGKPIKKSSIYSIIEITMKYRIV